MNSNRDFIKRVTYFFCFSLVLVLPLLVYALSLDEAKSKGLVGEEPTGYLGAVTKSSEVESLVNDINSKRRAKYQEIAKSNGTELSAVEALAGKKAIENSAAGSFVKLPSGAWAKK